MELKTAIRKYALENAVKFDGKANPGALVGKVMGEFPDQRSKAKELAKEINAIVLSPNNGRQSIIQYLESGAKEVIVNPFTEQKVISSIDYIVDYYRIKFADKAIPTMIGRMVNWGAHKKNIVAKIAGGAHMFPSIKDKMVMDIGKRNLNVIKYLLGKSGIKIIAEDTGLNIGRTIKFDIGTGRLMIKTKDYKKEL